MVEPNQLREAVWTFETQEDFCWPVVIMDGDVERSLSGDLELLCDVIAAVGKSKACGYAATTSRSIVKLSGRSVVCRVPLGTPATLKFLCQIGDSQESL